MGLQGLVFDEETGMKVPGNEWSSRIEPKSNNRSSVSACLFIMNKEREGYQVTTNRRKEG